MSEWISVEDRLPELSVGGEGKAPELTQDVLVYFDGVKRYDIAYYDSVDDNWHCWAGESTIVADVPPDAWMPLPDAPK